MGRPFLIGYWPFAGGLSGAVPDDAWRLISSTTATISSRKDSGASTCPQPDLA